MRIVYCVDYQENDWTEKEEIEASAPFLFRDNNRLYYEKILISRRILK